MTLRVSVIVPVRNGGVKFARCLDALSASDFPNYELLVVDDGSTESIPHAPRTLRIPHSLGPAAARNLGAREAQGDLLFFVDADVEVRPDTLARMAAAFDADPTLTAAFGSYDDAPAEPDFLSQYRNLFHHFVHQTAREEASTFWAGCGMVRREAFLTAGGFDAQAYPRPSIEDIDLGYRLMREGGRIKLLKEVQVKHLKRWRLLNLLKVDIVDRGIPWTRLLWRESYHPHRNSDHELLDLNLQRSSRLSVLLVYLLIPSALTLLAVSLLSLLPFLPFVPSFPSLPSLPFLSSPPFLPFVPSFPLSSFLLPSSFFLFIPSFLLLFLNRSLYRFFLQKRGVGFLFAAVPCHWLYYLYNGISFALGTLAYFFFGPPGTLKARAGMETRPSALADEG